MRPRKPRRLDVPTCFLRRSTGLPNLLALTDKEAYSEQFQSITNDTTYQANISSAANVAAWQAATQALYTAVGSSAGPAINPGTVYGGFQFPAVGGQTRDAYNTDCCNRTITTRTSPAP